MPEFSDPYLQYAVTVPAPVDAVWEAWTTESGVRSFFAPACNIDLEPTGPYEIYFRPEAPTGVKGGEGNVVLAIRAPDFLSFTWNAPPEQPTLRPHKTIVTISLEPVPDDDTAGEAELTQVTLTHLAWPPGDDWDACRTYFANAWENVVLPNLKERFTDGPIDWDNR